MSGSPSIGPLQTQLPPSPELKAGLPPSQLPEYSLDGANSIRPVIRRLRSVARYQSFYPRTLACSSTLSTYEDRGGKMSKGGNPTSVSCLGAVAGSQGVALFRLSKPHVPLLILSHATNSTAASSSISSLAFEPKESSTADSLYLAATRGSGVLLWDASGHTPNPLVGRMSMDRPGISDVDTRSTSMAWKPASPSPTLLTASASSLCLWDLRTPTKPSSKFDASRKAQGDPFVQVACSANDEVAVIDTAGVVQIYDVRMNSSRSQTAASSFAAHESAGVGVASFGVSRWLTWGLDAPLASAVIKIWTKREISSTLTSSADLPPSGKAALSAREYGLAAQCVRSNLACARVCISPVDNKFMAFGHVPSSHSSINKTGGWWAELYKLDDEASDTFAVEESLSIRTFGVETEAEFYGGEATHGGDKSTLASVLGSRTEVGGLQAAELSLAGARDGSDETSAEMIVCCLSQTGVISTHSVPEATPCQETSGSESPRRSRTSRATVVHTAFRSNQQARVYPEDREGASLSDAASFWGSSQVATESSILNRVDEGRLALDPAAQPPPLSQTKDTESSERLSHKAEVGFMPFDMDVPVAYGSVTAGKASNIQIATTDLSTGTVVAGNGVPGVVEEVGPPSGDLPKKPSVMESIETERVPCPPLCGARFGRGNGGLVIFHNGEVSKMWKWYQNAEGAHLPKGKMDPITAEHESLRQAHNATASGSAQPLGASDESTKPSDSSKYGPRTLKELVSMVSAAKEAQWGGDAPSDGEDSAAALSAGGNFFEDESLGSNSSDDDDDDDDDDNENEGDTIGHSQTDDMYARYFGEGSSSKEENKETGVPIDSSLPATMPPPPILGARSKKFRPFAGPSSDMLAPVVRLTRRYDGDILAGQNIAFAEGWQLGPWDTKLQDASDRVSMSLGAEESKSENPSLTFGTNEGPPPLPHALCSPQNTLLQAYQPMTRTKSDGNLGGKLRNTYSPSSTLTSRTGDSLRRMMKDSGLQGGDGVVRPNMEESMKFFKKLFNQPQDGGPAGFSTTLSPPDRPHTQFFSNYPSSQGRISSTGNLQKLYRGTTRPETDRKSSHSVKLGVITLRLPRAATHDGKKQYLSGIKDRCIHNASVCSSVGDNEKAGVWNLLARTIDRQMAEADGEQTFNGWGGDGGGALGVELVSNLLKYYEARGDCQMLATMACVLSGGRRSPMSQGQRSPPNENAAFLLPRDHEEKFDSYIRKYADLLYEWGLLSLRSELNKHLLRVPVDKSFAFSSQGAKTPAESRQPGIAVVFQCPRCGDETEFNSNVCRKCSDFAFRCIICDCAVKGLFTACKKCNHGGHFDHLATWFSNHMQCPTGCGCNCTLPSTPFGENEMIKSPSLTIVEDIPTM